MAKMLKRKPTSVIRDPEIGGVPESEYTNPNSPKYIPASQRPNEPSPIMVPGYAAFGSKDMVQPGYEYRGQDEKSGIHYQAKKPNTPAQTPKPNPPPAPIKSEVPPHTPSPEMLKKIAEMEAAEKAAKTPPPAKKAEPPPPKAAPPKKAEAPPPPKKTLLTKPQATLLKPARDKQVPINVRKVDFGEKKPGVEDLIKDLKGVGSKENLIRDLKKYKPKKK